jgi:hypothetical protein
LSKVLENAIETSQPKIAQVGHEFVTNVPQETVIVNAGPHAARAGPAQPAQQRRPSTPIPAGASN